jgi:hypothetical protein
VDEHQGFMIVVRFDKRFVLRFPDMEILARIHSNNRVIISGVPMESYALLYHSVEAIQKYQQSGTWGEFDFMLDGFTNGCNTYLTDHETSHAGLVNSSREFHVIFPSDVMLDVTCFKEGNPHEDPEFSVKLPCKILPTTNEYNISPSWESSSTTHSDLTGNSHWIVFYVARLDTGTFKKNRIAFNPKPKTSNLAQAFGI